MEVGSVFVLVFAFFSSGIMRLYGSAPQLLTALSYVTITKADREAASNQQQQCPANTDISLSWYPPPKTDLNQLDKVFTAQDTHGLIFDTSEPPLNGYDYCNMPHAHKDTYPEPGKGYQLEYVEVIQRHHKRTPYAHNVFPVENYPWYCDDENLYYGAMAMETQEGSRATWWQVYQSPQNPMHQGFNGSCQFPQMTRGGLNDAHKHGEHLIQVYRGTMGFLPGDYHEHTVGYRVTNNVITSQSGAFVLQGMWYGRKEKHTPLFIQPASIDSLEPSYPCKYADKLYASYGVGSDEKEWKKHLDQSSELKARLDRISGVDPEDEEWSQSWDHYFDNLSSKLCHDKALPCSTKNESDCVTREEADQVFRLGMYEYSYIYRDHPDSLNASVASYGGWISEIAQNIRQGGMGIGKSSVPGTSPRMRYRHNIAHDGSMARLLSILQANQMVWPGMGAEIIFEVFSKKDCFYVRVLWGGQILRSSHPAFGRMDMIPAETLLAYFDGLVGENGSKIPGMCRSNPH